MEKRSSIALITSILVISGIFLAILFNFKIKNTESPAASSSEISKTETKAETNNTDSKKEIITIIYQMLGITKDI